MHTPRTVAAIVVLAGAVWSCRPSAPAELSAKDITDIKAMDERWMAAFNTNKRDDLANIITADMVLMPPNSPALVGREAAMAYMKAYPPIQKLAQTTVDEIVGQGDLAYMRGTYSIDFTLPDGSPGHDQGTFLEIHHRQTDGTWPYSRLIWHSSEPLPAPPAAPTKE